MSTENHRRQIIEQVAGIIADQLRLNPEFGLSDARHINDATGWSFDARFRPAGDHYVDDRSFTRVEGAVLTEDELARAFILAREA